MALKFEGARPHSPRCQRPRELPCRIGNRPIQHVIRQEQFSRAARAQPGDFSQAIQVVIGGEQRKVNGQSETDNDQEKNKPSVDYSSDFKRVSNSKGYADR